MVTKMATHLIARHDNALPPPATAREEEIDLPTLVTTLTDRKWLILSGTLLFAAISLAYVLLATPQFEANAVVQVESRTPTVPGLPANAPAPAIATAPRRGGRRCRRGRSGGRTAPPIG